MAGPELKSTCKTWLAVQFQTIVNDIPARFNALFAGDRLVMQTDWQAPNKRIVVVDLNKPARDKWREIVPEGRDAIAGFSFVGGKLFVTYLHNVTTQMKIFTLDGNALGEVSLPGLGFVLATQDRPVS
jgi:prolyl oligopeptidase